MQKFYLLSTYVNPSRANLAPLLLLYQFHHIICFCYFPCHYAYAEPGLPPVNPPDSHAFKKPKSLAPAPQSFPPPPLSSCMLPEDTIFCI